MFRLCIIVLLAMIYNIIYAKSEKRKNENKRLLTELNLNKDYKELNMVYNENYPIYHYIAKFLTIITIITSIFFIIYFFKSLSWTMVSCGGTMYDEAGDPGGATGRDAYNATLELTFSYLPVILLCLLIAGKSFSLNENIKIKEYIEIFEKKEFENRKYEESI